MATPVELDGVPRRLAERCEYGKILNKDDGLHAMLINFDRRTARPPWAPPEICYIEYLDLLARLPALPTRLRDKHTRLVQDYIPDWELHSNKGQYRRMENKYSVVGSTNNGLNLEAFREEPCDQVFPEVRRSSAVVQNLIRRCTSGAPEWRGRYPSIVKREGLLWPRGMASNNGEPEGTAEDTQNSGKRWWGEELKDSDQFLTARVRQKQGNTSVMRDRHTLAVMAGRPKL
ncbi:uncharacterized protein PAC_11845 [Phialocephala subalpina]|uniref:Uncharacterized protein n=1 Tax=Phialocephala subalpina TaxID=576137 RepID=A0A1L7XA74_9HELO|nr:uncharacterized protein PAC_11845 [Phialocephala subalpina]